MKLVDLVSHETHWEMILKAPKVNVLNAALIDAIELALAEIEEAPRPVLVRSDHNDFVLGADITAFQTWFAEDSQALNDRISATQRVFDRFAELPAPTLAWVNGFALGGGFELALACDYRVLTNKARVGLPEVTLGLCPAWGGTVRTVQLAGLEKASELILSGRPISAMAAKQLGLADDIQEQIDPVIEYLLDQPAKRTDQANNESAPALSAIESTPSQQAQAAIVDLLNRNRGADFLAAQANEVEVFVRLAQSVESQALVQRYLNDQSTKRAAKKAISGDSNLAYVGVVGAGIMGGGIAWQCAVSGYTVMIRDVNAEALNAARAEVERLAGAALKKGRMSELQVSDVHARLSFSLELDALAPCDVVIEAVTEQESIKLRVLNDVDQTTRPEALVTSNTSTLSISGLASATQQPEKFAGLHFFNPVPVMPLVEVIRGQHTSDDTVSQLVSFAQRLKKRPVVVNDCPGFLVNRVLFPYLNAFDAMVADGVNIEHIDQVMSEFGWPMGPGLLSDVIGIDTCVHASDVMAQGFPDRMAVPEPSAMRERVSQSHLGQKTGQGFYRFEKDELGRLVAQGLADHYSEASKTPKGEEIIEMLMRPMVAELARCIDEGVVDSSGVADTACLLGLGFPAWRGGPLYWGQQQGWINGYY